MHPFGPPCIINAFLKYNLPVLDKKMLCKNLTLHKHISGFAVGGRVRDGSLFPTWPH